MPTGMQKIGLEAIFLTAAFTKGLDVYTKGVKQAKDATLNAASQINTIGTAIGGGMGTALQGAAAVFGVVGSAAAVAGAAIVGTMVAATTAVLGFSAAMIKLGIDAKAIEGVEFAFNRMAGTVGLSLDKLRDATAGTVSDITLMTEANKALLGASAPLAQAFGQDLPKIMEIARTAAKATGVSYEDAMNRITTAIKRGSTRGLAQLGLTVDLSDAETNMAGAVDGATDSLSAQEKQLEVLSDIIKQSDQYIATFSGSSETLSTKMSRAKATITNIKDALGQFFVPALKTAFDAINRLLEAFSKSIQEGGRLYDVFIKLGAIFQLVAEGFSKGVDILLNYVNDSSQSIEDSILDTVDKAFDWGLELVINFANGIIDGATYALNGAVNFITGLLSFWMAPGSPPKMLPNIDKWGAAVMTEYMRGFASADFDVLKTMQGPLKSILDVLSSSGGLSKAASKQLFLDISKSMISGLASGDLSGVYDKITNAAGTYGVELVKLIKLNMQYAAAQKKVADAEKAVADARKKEERLNTNLSLQLMEYNDLARAGASPQVLAAKLAGINATEDQLIAAQDETKAAEDSKTAAEEQMSVLKEQMQLQKDLVDTLIDLAKAEDEAIQAQKETAKGGAGGGLGTGLEDSLGAAWDGLGQTLQNKIDTAILFAKQHIKDKLHELFLELAPHIAGLMRAWDNFIDVATPVWNAIKSGWEIVTGAVDGFITKVSDGLKTWEGITTEVGTIFDLLNTKVNETLTSIGTGWDTFWGGVTLTWETWNTNFTTGWDTFWGGVKSTWDGWILDLTTGWDTFWGGVRSTWDGWITDFKTSWDTFWGDLKTGWDNFKRDVMDKMEASWNTITTAVSNLITKISEFLTKIKNAVIPKWILGNSPSDLELSLQGIGKAMTDLSKLKIPALQQSLSMTPAMASQPISTAYNNTANVHMGGVSIYNGMGTAELESVIRRVMKSQMAGA